jgi:hypothetical protein
MPGRAGSRIAEGDRRSRRAGEPILSSAVMTRARQRALCARQNWEDRSSSRRPARHGRMGDQKRQAWWGVRTDAGAVPMRE